VSCPDLEQTDELASFVIRRGILTEGGLALCYSLRFVSCGAEDFFDDCGDDCTAVPVSNSRLGSRRLVLVVASHSFRCKWIGSRRRSWCGSRCLARRTRTEAFCQLTSERQVRQKLQVQRGRYQTLLDDCGWLQLMLFLTMKTTAQQAS